MSKLVSTKDIRKKTILSALLTFNNTTSIALVNRRQTLMK